MFQIVSELQRHPVYSKADPAALQRLASHCRIRELQAGEPLYGVGDEAQSVFVLTEGLIRVYQRSAVGLQTTQVLLTPPNGFGEKTVLAESWSAERRGYPENTEALNPSRLVELPATPFLTFLGESPASTYELLCDLSARFAASALREVDVLLSVPARLASLLLSYAQAAGVRDEHGIRIKVPLANAQMAANIGAVTRSVTRALQDWGKQGIIGRRKGWIVIHDPEALVKECGGAPINFVYAVKPPTAE